MRFRLLIPVLLAAAIAFALNRVVIRVLDENGVAVPNATVVVEQAGSAPVTIRTDYLGRANFTPTSNEPFSIKIEKPGFYVLHTSQVSVADEAQFVITHQQQIQQQIDVVGAPPAIDPEQQSDASRMQTPEIVNVPYPTSRDVRNLLPFNPGVVQDVSGQVHVAGSETWQTQNLLEGFNITSPVSGTLSMRLSADAVRSIETESTRYPVEFGKTSGGIIAFHTGMGDDKFRFNATNFIPSFQNKKGITFDKFVPRFTFSGPLKKGRAWFYDGLELEYDNNVVEELPDGQDTSRLWRGSNLGKAQVNVTQANILTFGGLANLYRSPYEGLGPLNPQSSTFRRDITSGFAFIRDQQTFRDGTVLEVGIAGITFDDALKPHGSNAYIITPEGTKGSYFETRDSTSHRIQERVDLYVSPQQWLGKHVLKIGADLDQIQYAQDGSRKPIEYLRPDGTLLRRSEFPNAVDLAGTNFEAGAYIQDQYSPAEHWVIEPGVRFDWDRIVGRGLVSPRIAATYVFGGESTTKLSAGIGLYYDHTQLDLIQQTQEGPRFDTMFAPDGTTPIGSPVESNFTYVPGSLRAPRTLNWSVGIERKLPHNVFLRANFMQKRTDNQFTFANSDSIYTLTNTRNDRYKSLEITARKNFAKGYALFGSYVWSHARTNAAIDYMPTYSWLGPQQPGPLPWDTPNRFISWGWLPFFHSKRLDFVYTLDLHSGFPFTSVNANQEVVGEPYSRRFPTFVSFSPGLEFRFHIRKTYFGLRGIVENITGSQNPYGVNNNVDSPNYLRFNLLQKRSFTARIRIIQ